MRKVAAILIAPAAVAVLVFVVLPAVRARGTSTETVTVTVVPTVPRAEAPGKATPGHAVPRHTVPRHAVPRRVVPPAPSTTTKKVATTPVVTVKTTPAPTPRPPGDGAQIVVRVDPAAQLVSLPRSFLGLSTEYWSLPVYERRSATFRRLLALLHVPGDGPVTLRIGGTSADHTYWGKGAGRRRFNSYVLGPKWVAGLAALTRAARLRVIIDLNLAAHDPGMAALFTGLLVKALPRRSIAAVEVGNEPDLYSTQPYYRLARVARGPVPTAAVWAHYSSTIYASEFRAYARAIALTAPRVRLAGPVLAEPWSSTRWIDTLLAHDRAAVSLLTAHRYPMSSCAAPGTADYPTIARLLSSGASTGVAESLEPAIALAHDASLKLDLTELDSVACGGLAGVSNTFATALWAPDTLFSLLRVGVDNVEVHVRNHAINAAFAPRGGRLSARPLMYGLLTFERTLGADAKLVSCTHRGDSAANFTAWGVLVRGRRLHVLLLDKGGTALRVDVRVPSSLPARAQWLLAPSVGATRGVTLAGQHLGGRGRWIGHPVSVAVAATPFGYRVTLPAYSAALLTIPLGPAMASDRAGSA